jgi:hypothetical protein
MKTLVLLALLCSVAIADPRSVCKPSGVALLQVQRQPVVPGNLPIWTVKLYNTGAWTVQETTTNGTPGASSSGCLDKASLAKIDAALAAMTWKTFTPRFRCMARSNFHTIYSVHGEVKFTEELCGSVVLDDSNAKKLAEIRAILDKATGPLDATKHSDGG